MKYSTRHQGFTIVELLIVIVVIAVLAAISIVAYNGIQDRAKAASLQSDLANAAKAVGLASANTGEYPTSLPSEVKASAGNVLQLTASAGKTFCINGYNQQGLVASVASGGAHKNYLCDGALIGSPVGGSIPTVPKGTNLVPDFSAWTVSNGMSYNAATNQVCGTTSGTAKSPLVRVEGPASVKFTVDTYATQPSPNGNPGSRGYYSSSYYDTDGITAVTNTSGYTGNGNAQDIPLSTWTTHSWSTTAGSAVKYIRFTINSTPTTYTSDNCYRKPRITIP